MKILGVFIILLTSFAAVNVLPPIVGFCAGGDDDYVSRPAFLFNPDMSGGADLQPLYFTWNQFYDNSWYDNADGRSDNIQEWNKYFNNGLRVDQISTLIYETDKNVLRQLQVYAGKQPGQIEESFRNNVYLTFFHKNSYPDFLPYLYFAKECEPYVTESFEWLDEEQIQNNKDSMSVLLGRAKILYVLCRSEFIKMRYGFQIMRLAHYTGRYQECVDFYDKYVALLKTKSIFSYWALEHKAGALLKLGRVAEASYLFSLIFDQCPSRKFTSYQSFNITSDSSWQETLNLCKTLHEKTTVYFLRAITPYAYTLEEMKNVYQIDPSSIHLNILLVRDINKLEERFHRERFDLESSYHWDSFSSNDTAYLKLLQEFVILCRKEAKVRNPDLWTLADGYIDFLLGNYDKAKTIYTALRTTNDTLIKKHLPLFEVALSIAAIKKLNKNHEEVLFSQVLLSNHDELLPYTISIFKQLALQNGDTIKAFLCSHSLENIREDFSLPFVDKTISWVNNPKKTVFEKYLSEHKLQNWVSDVEPMENLLELKATILFSQNKLREAITTFRQTPNTEIWSSDGDPFASRINDCRDCDFQESESGLYDKLSLAEKILEYEEKIKTDPAHSAQYYYLLGNAYYNITYFGNSAEAILYHRNPNMWWQGSVESIPPPFDCRRAQHYYQKGMEAADAKGDKELAAKCCFMAAKCEQNLYFVANNENDEQGTIKKEKFRTNFRILRDKYKLTKFYLKALDECKYFHTFVTK